MILHQDTYQIQEKLGTYCKTGKEEQIPGLTPNRVRHYRRLVYNVIKGTLTQGFPLCHQVMGEEGFDSLVHKFFSEYNCQTPQIWKLPEEFYEWVIQNKISEKLNLPWLNDLLLFEWIEIEVHTMEDQIIPTASDITDLFNNLLVINPEYRLIRIEYPVHLFNIKEVENKKGNYFILISRHPETGKVYFFNLSVLHAWLFEKIADGDISVQDLIPEIATIFRIESEVVLKNNLEKVLRDLVNKKVILGAKN